jgi:hypothetical protein
VNKPYQFSKADAKASAVLGDVKRLV